MMKATIKKIVKHIIGLSCGLVPCDPKLIVFTSFHGKGYMDNPKAIYEEMCRDERFDTFRKVWLLKDVSQNDGLDKEKFGSLKGIMTILRAKAWVFNCKMPYYLKKKSNQIYLQTWHGTPLKRLGCDINLKEGATFYTDKISEKEMKESYRVDSAKYDYLISPSDFTSEVFQTAFDMSADKLLEVGYPRNDVLFNVDPDKTKEIRKQLGIEGRKKVVLYAPTWRDNSFDKNGYTFDLQVNFALWKEYLADDYVVLFKPHYLITTKFDLSNYKGFVYEIDAGRDIADLYALADVLVTDYSSVFFDYAILKRPIYFYMYDLESYMHELRGFYIDINRDLPGEIYREEKEMLIDIKSGKFDYNKLMGFSKRFNSNEDGRASKKVVDILYKDITKSQ